MITENEKRKERDYLKTVLYILEKKLKSNKATLQTNEEDITQDMRYIWKDGGIHDPDELELLKDQVIQQKMLSDSYSLTISQQERMINSAYFARIDFDDGTEVMPIYLGIASLVDGNHFYIYDWRAPICSMFYDAEMGDASYKLPDGTTVKGKITLKRQYVIKGDEIKEMFDTELQVVDGILQKMLSGNASTRMKNIVKTIQKEQNKIIRNNSAQVLVVQGPAGSGKTSVAMHRIAYLLYAQKDKLKNSNVLIISPNEIFTSYISGVLPSIGEDNVYQTTYRDYVKAFTTEFKIKGDMADVYECLYTQNRRSVMFNSINLKFSSVYYHVMESWLEKNRNEILGIADITLDNEVLIGKDFLQKYADSLNKQTSLVNQAELINQKIISHLSIKLNKEPKLKTKIIKALRARIDKIHARTLYTSLYENEEVFVEQIETAYNELATPKQSRLNIRELKEVFLYTRDLLKKDTIPYEDVMNYLLLKGRVRGFAPQDKIKHVVIDEAQDYTTLQYDLLAKMFPNASFTVVGDTNQAIMPMAQHKNYDSIINILLRDRPYAHAEMQYLAKTYRSTYEINTFAKSLVADKLGYKQVERHGDPVRVVTDIRDIPSKRIFQDAVKQKRRYQNVAIICRTEMEVETIKEALVASGMDRKFEFVNKNTVDFDTKKVQIIPSYIAKGLEFDSVLVYNADVYKNQNLFYVVCTRALHKLNIYHEEPIFGMLKHATEENDSNIVEIE